MVKEFPHISQISAFLKAENELFVVYDRNVEWVASQLPSRSRMSIDASEKTKRMETVLDICRWLLAQGATRKALLLAVGGGITTDIAGFAAGIYKRGIRYANLPTTLLSQVDAALGGKTGVNLDGYKNILGVFRMPEYSFICPEVLKTLPERQLKAGKAELLKTFLLSDGKAYEEACAAGDIGPWIARAAAVKEGIVAEDPFEEGVRAKLNLGHTFGHAIEHTSALKGDDISHGEAVAMGMLLAARLGESLGISEKGLAARLREDFLRAGLPTQCPYPLEALKAAMEKDKKAVAGGKVKFALPVRPGEVVFKELDPHDLHFPTE